MFVPLRARNRNEVNTPARMKAAMPAAIIISTSVYPEVREPALCLRVRDGVKVIIETIPGVECAETSGMPPAVIGLPADRYTQAHDIQRSRRIGCARPRHSIFVADFGVVAEKLSDV